MRGRDQLKPAFPAAPFSGDTKMFQDLDIYVDRIELEQLGLTDEEIEGYFAFFALNYLGSKDDRIN